MAIPKTQAVVIVIPDGSGGESILEIDACLSEGHSLTNTVTDQPVEVGSPISDHSRPESRRLTLDCIVSNTPLGRTPGEDFAYAAWKQLVDLHEKPRLLTVSTSRGLYRNMAIENVSNPVDAKTAGALIFTVSLKQVRLVQNRLTRIKIAKTPKAQPKVKKGAVMTFTLEESDPDLRNQSIAFRASGLPVQ
mgnify:FL=1